MLTGCLAPIDNDKVYNHFDLADFRNKKAFSKDFTDIQFKYYAYNLFHLKDKICKDQFISFEELIALAYFRLDNI